MASSNKGQNYAGVCDLGSILNATNGCNPCSTGSVANPQQTQCLPFCAVGSNLASDNTSQCICGSGHYYDATRRQCGLTIETSGKISALVAGVAIILVLVMLAIHVLNERVIKKEEEGKSD